MKLTSETFRDQGAIPARCAFCAPDPKTHATLGENRSPQLAWSGLPAGTKSLALDVERCPVQGKFRGADVVKVIQGRILGEAVLTGLHSLNPAVRA